MRNVRTLTLGSLVAVGGFLGGSISVAWGQSACIIQCRDKGWAQGQCSIYCASSYGAPDYNRRSSGPLAPVYTGTSAAASEAVAGSTNTSRMAVAPMRAPIRRV